MKQYRAPISKQSIIKHLLLDGHYALFWRTGSTGRACYRLYNKFATPMHNVPRRTFEHAVKAGHLNCTKTDKRGRITLNLSLIRQLSKKSTLKTLYLQLKTENDGKKTSTMQ